MMSQNCEGMCRNWKLKSIEFNLKLLRPHLRVNLQWRLWNLGAGICAIRWLPLQALRVVVGVKPHPPHRSDKVVQVWVQLVTVT
jgi:hypothetical protein